MMLSAHSLLRCIQYSTMSQYAKAAATGSHDGTGIEPVRFEVKVSRNAALCLCKRTGNKPFCDGSHSDL